MNNIFIKIFIRVVLWLAIRHRAIGIRDWLATTAAISILALPWIIFGISKAINEMGPERLIGLVVAFCGTLFWWCAVGYILRLRRNGITDADATIKGGIDYKVALSEAGKGFSFMGVGAAKLTSQQSEFLTSVRRAQQQGSLLRFILVDPENSAGIEKLEEFDGAKHYKTLVENSQNLIKSAGGESVEIRRYGAPTNEDLEPYRLFITEDACLVSPFVPSTGVDDQGSGLPQLRISSRGFPKRDSPTLYRAFRSYFEKKWSVLGE